MSLTGRSESFESSGIVRAVCLPNQEGCLAVQGDGSNGGIECTRRLNSTSRVLATQRGLQRMLRTTCIAQENEPEGLVSL